MPASRFLASKTKRWTWWLSKWNKVGMRDGSFSQFSLKTGKRNRPSFPLCFSYNCLSHKLSTPVHGSQTGKRAEPLSPPDGKTARGLLSEGVRGRPVLDFWAQGPKILRGDSRQAVMKRLSPAPPVPLPVRASGSVPKRGDLWMATLCPYPGTEFRRLPVRGQPA